MNYTDPSGYTTLAPKGVLAKKVLATMAAIGSVGLFVAKNIILPAVAIAVIVYVIWHVARVGHCQITGTCGRPSDTDDRPFPDKLPWDDGLEAILDWLKGKVGEEIWQGAESFVQDLLRLFADALSQSAESENDERESDCSFPRHSSVYSRFNPADQNVLNLAAQIRTQYPTLEMCVNEEFLMRGDTTTPIGEVDIELEYIIIEYKSGRNSETDAELSAQIINLQSPLINVTGKRIVYFAPRIRLHATGQPPYQETLIRRLGAVPIGKKYTTGDYPDLVERGMNHTEFVNAIPVLNTP